MENVSSRNWSLLGITDHSAVMNLGGRLGSAQGPQAFRSAWKRLSGKVHLTEQMLDYGDCHPVGSSVLEIHDHTIDWIASRLTKSRSVIIGGSHDHGYTHLAAIKKNSPKKRIGCINLDAHLDVRKPDPLPSSGSPFYLAIENQIIRPEDFIEFGIQRQCNGPTLWNYIESKSIDVVPMENCRFGKAILLFQEKLKFLEKQCDEVVISLDIDCVNGAEAPGVSAPAPEGLTSSDLLAIMNEAGRSKKVQSLGIFELNPIYDIDQRTARLCAAAVWHFLS
ncbi:MAG: hypothetical protein CL678_12775 [Bdellovibrionaceae bacterium]|nr:hypothetical protein [Pseudobdellovibrionaceae bacterium]|tara:strand:+ start:1342 stop:2178 length:837 start_codon:yes stop_codon:yes gene_type:complete